MTSLLIRTISDLYRTASVSICFLTGPHQRKPRKKKKKKGLAGSFRSRWWSFPLFLTGLWVLLHGIQVEWSSNMKRTDGIAA